MGAYKTSSQRNGKIRCPFATNSGPIYGRWKFDFFYLPQTKTWPISYFDEYAGNISKNLRWFGTYRQKFSIAYAPRSFVSDQRVLFSDSQDNRCENDCTFHLRLFEICELIYQNNLSDEFSKEVNKKRALKDLSQFTQWMSDLLLWTSTILVVTVFSGQIVDERLNWKMTVNGHQQFMLAILDVGQMDMERRCGQKFNQS